MKITFYEHADRKFEVLRSRGFAVTRSQVLETVQSPASVLPGRKGRKVAEKPVSATHKLRHTS